MKLVPLLESMEEGVGDEEMKCPTNQSTASSRRSAFSFRYPTLVLFEEMKQILRSAPDIEIEICN